MGDGIEDNEVNDIKQLLLKKYQREEIAEVLSLDPMDNKHFKRNVETKLSNWGYGFRYEPHAIEILTRPEAPSERLAELLFRGYNINIQVAPIPFACFMASFTDIDRFESMPWGQRELEYRRFYGYCVSERTLRNWCRSLIQRGIMMPDRASSIWKTEYVNNCKIRRPVEEDEKPYVQRFLSRRKELVESNL